MIGRLRPKHLRINGGCRRYQAHLSAVGEHVGVSVRILRSGEALSIVDRDGAETIVHDPYFSFQDVDLSHSKAGSMLLVAYLAILSRTSREWVQATMGDDHLANSSGMDGVARVILQVVGLLPSCEKYLSLSVRWGTNSPYATARRPHELCLRVREKPDFDLEPVAYAAVLLYGALSDSSLFTGAARELQSNFDTAELANRLEEAHRTLTNIMRFSELDRQQVAEKYDETVRLLEEGRIMASFALSRFDVSAEVPLVRPPTWEDLDYLCPGATPRLDMWVGPLSDDHSRVCLRVHYSTAEDDSPLHEDVSCRPRAAGVFEVVGPLGPNALRSIAGRNITSREDGFKNIIAHYLSEVSELQALFPTLVAASESSSR